MDHEKLMVVIKDHFEVDQEVYEVAMYAMSTLAITDAILRGVMTKVTEIRGIPPESYKLMRDFDNGLTVNEFWLKNYAPIKMQLVLDDIKLNTTREYIQFGESIKDDPIKLAFKQVRAILLSRLDVLTIIAFLWKGLKYAQDFDAKIRIAVQLSAEHENYFNSKGI